MGCIQKIIGGKPFAYCTNDVPNRRGFEEAGKLTTDSNFVFNLGSSYICIGQKITSKFDSHPKPQFFGSCIGLGVTPNYNEVNGTIFSVKTKLDGDFSGLMISGWNSVKGNMTGAQMAFWGSSVEGNMTGAQMAFGGNFVEGNVTGAQMAFSANFVGGNMTGAQIMAVVGANFVEGNVTGAQMAFVGGNFVEGNVTGAQMAVVTNFVRNSMIGAQMAFVANEDGAMKGLALAGFVVSHDERYVKTEILPSQQRYRTSSSNLSSFNYITFGVLSNLLPLKMKLKSDPETDCILWPQ